MKGEGRGKREREREGEENGYKGQCIACDEVLKTCVSADRFPENNILVFKT